VNVETAPAVSAPSNTYADVAGATLAMPRACELIAR
jgi:hypothetical protein